MSLKNLISSNEYPSIRQVKQWLKYNSISRYDSPILNAYVVGSYAKGTNTKNSDLDIAVIIPKKKLPSVKVTEHYHSKFTNDDQKPKWKGVPVDIQFFYQDDEELNTYSKIELK